MLIGQWRENFLDATYFLCNFYDFFLKNMFALTENKSILTFAKKNSALFIPSE